MNFKFKTQSTRISRYFLMNVFLLISSNLFLSACNQSKPAGNTTPTVVSPEISALYQQNCQSCHSLPSSGAPQLGDQSAWSIRAKQGLPQLLDHAINGYKSMPPMGGCVQCTEADFSALITYMASGTLQ